MKSEPSNAQSKSNDQPDEAGLPLTGRPITSLVEPFLDLDVRKSRSQLIDEAIFKQQVLLIKEKLGSPGDPDFYEKVVTILAEISSEIHRLNAAYITQTRYQEASFEVALPNLPKKQDIDSIEIDMRTDITGGNWWKAEAGGRWAGPENESSLLVPAIGPGRYRLEIRIIDEIESGIIDGTSIIFNHTPLTFDSTSSLLPRTLSTDVEVLETYRFPFWVLKFLIPRLVSPTEHGSKDPRKLSIRVLSVHFTRAV